MHFEFLAFFVVICFEIVTSRGPHHPRGQPVIRRNHVHYKPNSNEKLIQDEALIHDKTHIEEHLESEIKPKDISNMTDEELDFYYFQLHDTDQNNKLDGLEILQAISHVMDEDSSNSLETSFNYYIGLIDQVLQDDDKDNDGYLSYVEYITARKKSPNIGKTKTADIPQVQLV